MTKPLTNTQAIDRLCEMFPNAERCAAGLKIDWKAIVFWVETDPYDDIEMGPDDLIVGVYPQATWDDYSDRTDFVEVVADGDTVVSMIDGLTDDAPDGCDHTVWAMESALVHFAGCPLYRV